MLWVAYNKNDPLFLVFLCLIQKDRCSKFSIFPNFELNCLLKVISSCQAMTICDLISLVWQASFVSTVCELVTLQLFKFQIYELKRYRKIKHDENDKSKQTRSPQVYHFQSANRLGKEFFRGRKRVTVITHGVLLFHFRSEKITEEEIK